MITCPECTFENPADSAFCQNCGRSLAIKCTNCGERLDLNAKYCNHCGAPQGVALRATGSGTRIGKPGSGSLPRDETARLAELHQSMPGPLAQKILSTRGQVEGERKQVTVLFTDIVDSTMLAEEMDPEQWALIVNGAHRLVTDQVYRYEGTVAQLLGDGVLCFFGAPVSHEDDPERAVRAALGIIDGLRDYAPELERRFGVHDLRMRIGLNTGLVVVGSVGTSLHFEYLAIGDSVNLAARLQSEAHPNTVLMAENTHRLVSTLFDFRDRGELAVKGKAAPVRAYEVIRERLGAPKRRGVAGLSSPMVGRERELATLKRLAEELPKGRGTVVSVIGDAGLGKSRLLAEWRRWVLQGANRQIGQEEGTPIHIRWAEGRCHSYGVRVAYHLLVDLTRSLLDVPASLPDLEMRETIQARLREMVADKPDLYEEAYPFLAHLLSLRLEPEEAERVRYLEPQALQTRYVDVIRLAFKRLAQDAPIILVCEDIHWADPPSVELLSRLLPLVTELPLLVCLACRPDRDTSGWRLTQSARDIPGVGAIELHLATLSGGDSRKLISNLMEGDMPVYVRDMILSKAEGNPFFVEEVIGFLVDRGLIRRGEGRWVATRDLRQIEIPETIQGVLMARVDQLAEEVRRTLQVASVIGREFSFELLLNVLERQGARVSTE